MKVQISFLPTEATCAARLKASLSKMFPRAKIKEREGSPPRRIIYATIKEVDTVCQNSDPWHQSDHSDDR